MSEDLIFESDETWSPVIDRNAINPVSSEQHTRPLHGVTIVSDADHSAERSLQAMTLSGHDHTWTVHPEIGLWTDWIAYRGGAATCWRLDLASRPSSERHMHVLFDSEQFSLPSVVTGATNLFYVADVSKDDAEFDQVDFSGLDATIAHLQSGSSGFEHDSALRSSARRAAAAIDTRDADSDQEEAWANKLAQEIGAHDD